MTVHTVVVFYGFWFISFDEMVGFWFISFDEMVDTYVGHTLTPNYVFMPRNF